MTQRRSGLFLTLAALALASCTDLPVAAPDRTAAEARMPDAAKRPIPGRYIVVFKDDVADAPGLARRLAASHAAEVHHTYRHALKGFAATLPEPAVAALRSNPNVAYVEQDQMATHGNTTQLNATWGLDRIDQRDLPLSGTYTYGTTGQGVRVYVIDSGIETGHPEFAGRASVGYDALGGNGQDCNGHGTHVAGTIGGVTYGVAKQASLIGVRVFPCSGGSAWSTIIAGVDWVTGNHVKPAVANMSLWGPASPAMDDAVRNSVAAGVAYSVIAGNDGGQNACNYSPARVAEALTVGATTSGDARASFSNVGTCVNIFAPGESITSAWLYGGTNTINGTSMAAPHVAGAAARYLQLNTGASPATVNAAIINAATIGRISGAGTGSPNRLLYVDPAAPPPPSGSQDDFGTNTLANYTIYNTPHAWSISGGYLHATADARQSVVIRNGATIGDGWVETETDLISDGGLVLRFQSSGNYYLLAIRDDSRFGYANLEIYRAQGGSFTRIAGPLDTSFPRGTNRKVRFETRGSALTAYLDGVQVLHAVDGTYTSGGFGLRHDNTRGETGITSRFDVLRWGTTPSGTDPFTTNTLGLYTIYNTPGAWSISGGYLHGDASARQSVVVRGSTTMANGWVETQTDQVSDGGLVLRFQSSGNYYLLAVRDDSRFGYANVEMYRAQGGSFTRIAGPVNLNFPRGTPTTVRFQASGTTLTAYLDGTQVLQTTDGTYGSGGFGLRHDNTRAETGITSRFDLLRWNAL